MAFVASKPVAADTAALDLRAAAGRVGIAFGSTGLSVQFPLARHWPSPTRVGRVTGRSPDQAARGSTAGGVSVACTRSGGARSDSACFPDAARQVLGPVQKVKGCEIVRTTVIVLPALAGPEENTRVLGCRRLRRLHIEVIGVQVRFSRYGDSTRDGSKIITLRWKAECSGKLLELAPGAAVECTLCSIVVGDRLSEIEVGGRLGHDRDSESG